MNTMILDQIDQFLDSISILQNTDKVNEEESQRADRLQEALEKNERWHSVVGDSADIRSTILAAAVSFARHGKEYPVMYPNGLNIEDTCYLLGETPGETISFEELRSLYDWARKFLILRHDPKIPFFRHMIKADERMLSYLAGENVMDIRLREDRIQMLDQEPETLFVGQQVLEEIKKGVSFRKAIVQLSGGEGSGRRFLLSHACRELKVPMLLVDYRRFFGRHRGELIQVGRAIAREALFQKAGVCFCGIDQENCAEGPAFTMFYDLFLRPLEGLGQPVCICTDPETELGAMMDTFVFCVRVPELTRSERIDLWTGLAQKAGLGNRGDWVEAGSKFHLSGKEIHKAVTRLTALCAGEDRPITPKEVGDACMAVLPPPTQGSIKKVNVKYTLDDLKLPERQKQMLQNICAHLTQRHRVYDEWNMESRFAYGRNVSALFVGPPGTGKTMAVHVLSTMMGLPLYRIDLSQVVDKYIGETEKRLEEIFTAAEKSNSILFFDEADSVFGKRSEVNDAKDKYANTEVSYILQRIEQYDGIVILATNYKKNIDEAFMRRMRYMIEFQLPGEELRRQLWESSFAKEVPLQGVDFPYLARQFELSGGAIKNIVLNATFLAADEGKPVNMKHILDSLRNENLKIGKPMLAQDFAEYGMLQR